MINLRLNLNGGNCPDMSCGKRTADWNSTVLTFRRKLLQIEWNSNDISLVRYHNPQLLTERSTNTLD